MTDWPYSPPPSRRPIERVPEAATSGCCNCKHIVWSITIKVNFGGFIISHITSGSVTGRGEDRCGNIYWFNAEIVHQSSNSNAPSWIGGMTLGAGYFEVSITSEFTEPVICDVSDGSQYPLKNGDTLDVVVAGAGLGVDIPVAQGEALSYERVRVGSKTFHGVGTGGGHYGALMGFSGNKGGRVTNAAMSKVEYQPCCECK